MFPKQFIIIPLLHFLILSINISAQTDTVFNRTDAGNMKQGWWKKSYPNGKLMYKGYFRDNRAVGEMRRYYETGILKAVMKFDSSGKSASARLFYEDGQLAAEGRFLDSMKDSTWSYYSYYEHALAARETYIKGLRHGIMEHFYNDGSLSELITWVDNKKDGPWVQYFANHVLKLKGSYSDGMLEGDFLVNFESGKPFLKGSYKNDLREGRWIFYKEDGSVDMELAYQNGKTTDEEKLDQKQQELFRMIDENQGKFEEPDETNFLTPIDR